MGYWMFTPGGGGFVAMMVLHALFACVLAWLVGRQLPRPWGIALGLWTLLGTLVAHCTPAGAIPAQWFTLLFEGRTLRAIQGVGALSPHYVWLGFAHMDLGAPARMVIVANLWAAAVGWPLVAAWLSNTTGRAWTGPAAVLALLSAGPVFRQTLFSEHLAGYLTLVLAGMLWGGTALRRQRVDRVLGLALIVLAVVLAASARRELALLGLVLPFAVLRGDARPLPPGWAGTALGLAGTIVASYAVTLIGWVVVGEPAPSPPWSSLEPGQTSLRWPADLVQLYPAWVVFLVTLGVAHAARRPIATAGLGVAFVTLMRVYAANGHFGEAWFELLRYVGHVQVLLVVLLGAGVAEARHLWRQSERLGRQVCIAVGGASLVWWALPPLLDRPGGRRKTPGRRGSPGTINSRAGSCSSSSTLTRAACSPPLAPSPTPSATARGSAGDRAWWGPGSSASSRGAGPTSGSPPRANDPPGLASEKSVSCSTWGSTAGWRTGSTARR